MRPVPKAKSTGESLDESPQGLGFDAAPPAIDELVAENNVEGLLELGSAYRAGTAHVPRDLGKSVECFLRAADLGSDDAQYLAAMAHFNGSGVPEDLAEGARRLRIAAQNGHLRAKVYLANMYELGIHHKTDAEKADVWYRAVARTAGIDSDPGSPEFALEMAELGSARHALSLIADETLPVKDRHFYLRKAKAMGYGQFLRQAKAVKERARAELLEKTAEEAKAQAAAPEPEPAVEPSSATHESATSTRPEPKKEPREAPAPLTWTWGAGLAAFLVSSFFLAASSVAGWLAMEGARAFAMAQNPLPFVGDNVGPVLWTVVFLFGILPSTIVYRPRVTLIGTLAALAAGAGGFFSHAVAPLISPPEFQATALALAIFVAVTFFLGVLGGTRLTRAAEPKRTRR
jgi:hypothetical protein